MEWIVSIDLGKINDYTAFICARKAETNPPIYLVEHIERFEIGLPTLYPSVVRRMRKVLGSEKMEGARFIADGTGVGMAVVDMFREHQETRGVIPISITCGKHATWNQEGNAWHVPKLELISVMQSLLPSKRVKINDGSGRTDKAHPDVDLGPVLAKEMKSFDWTRKHKTDDSQMTLELWREKTNDDTVLALAMLLWYGERGRGINYNLELIGERIAAATDEVVKYPFIRFFRPHKTFQPVPKVNGQEVLGCLGYDTQEEALLFSLELLKRAGERVKFEAPEDVRELDERKRAKVLEDVVRMMGQRGIAVRR